MKPKRTMDFHKGGIKLEFYESMFLVSSSENMKILSSAIKNGGLKKSRYILNMTVRSLYYNDSPEDEITYYEKILGIEGIVGMMTAADVNKASFRQSGGVAVIATAGVSNAATPGEKVEIWKNGTINILVITENELTDEAMANAIITTTEAKSLVFALLDIRSVNGGKQATGTTTDCVAIASLGKGECIRYTSSGTDIGRTIGRLVFECVLESLMENNSLYFDRPIKKRLSERKTDMEKNIERVKEIFPILSKINIDQLRKDDETIRYLYISGLRALDEFQNNGNASERAFLSCMGYIGKSIAENLGGRPSAKEYKCLIDDDLFKVAMLEEPILALDLGLLIGIKNGRC